MAYWFTTQDPGVLDRPVDEHGVWESKRGRGSGDNLRRHDKVAIYEVGQCKTSHDKGAAAVVAIVQVERRIKPPEGPDELGFWKIAKARLIASDKKGLPAEIVKSILGGVGARGNFGLCVLQRYGGRVTPVSYRKFAKIENYLGGDAKLHRARKIEATEGAEQIAETTFRKRYRPLVDEKKRTSDYRCEVCQMSFDHVYGDRGSGFIVVHHGDPIGMRKEPSKTTLDDLSIVCANCHAMLHHGPLVTVNQLRKIVKSLRSKHQGISTARVSPHPRQPQSG